MDPRFAPEESWLTIGLRSWLPSPVTKERTIARRWACRDNFVNVLPKVMPGRLVFTSPVELRISAGAVIFGSNVSNWLGPPCMNRKMTDFPEYKEGVLLAAWP